MNWVRLAMASNFIAGFCLVLMLWNARGRTMPQLSDYIWLAVVSLFSFLTILFISRL